MNEKRINFRSNHENVKFYLSMYKHMGLQRPGYETAHITLFRLIRSNEIINLEITPTSTKNKIKSDLLSNVWLLFLFNFRTFRSISFPIWLIFLRINCHWWHNNFTRYGIKFWFQIINRCFLY